jgi:hypothetical protein
MIWINCLRLSPSHNRRFKAVSTYAHQSFDRRERVRARGAIIASTAVFIFLSGCGRSANTPGAVAPSIASRPDVTVTFDGKRRKCVVALPSEAQGSSISCADVVPFVKDELRLPSGSFYDIRKIPDVDEAEIARVRADLSGAGYRFVGGSHQ